MRRALALLAVFALFANAAPARAAMTTPVRVPLALALDDKNQCLAEEPLDLGSASGPGYFLQRDPLGYEDSVNLYAGFKHDPVNNRDPTGRAVPAAIAACAAIRACRIALGGAVGALVGGGVELARQLLSDKDVDPDRIGAAAVGGGVYGAALAATFGGSVLAGGSLTVSDLAAGGVISIAAESTEAAVNGEPYTLEQGAVGFVPGGINVGAGEAGARMFRPPVKFESPAAGRLSLMDSTPRANEIREQLVEEGIITRGRARRLPVGVVDASDPNIPRIITIGDEDAHNAIAAGRFKLKSDEVLGPAPRFDEDGRLLLESHVEPLGVQEATQVYGATGGEVGSVPIQCAGCDRNMTGSNWRHTNPRRPRFRKP